MKRLLAISLAVVLTLGLSFVPLLAQSTMADPGDINVPSDYSTIQAAINAASPGDTVLVAAGTYAPSTNGETFPINMKNGVSLQGAGAAITILDAENTNGVIACNGISIVTTKLDGFTITNGNAFQGGGIYLYGSSPTISNCIVSGNSAQYGGGIFNYVSSPTVTNCTLSGNSGREGGGMYIGTSSPTVTNCIVSGNSAQYGGGMYIRGFPSAPTVTNCTVSGNSATGLGGGIRTGDYWASPIVTNCILWGNGNDLSNCSATYSDIEDGDPGEGNIQQDPMFVGPGSGDFHLQASSACIDVGNNSAPSLPSTDFEGDPRIWPETGVVDMGADEFVLFNQPPVADAGSDQTVEANTLGGANVTLDGSGSSDPDGDPLTYTWTWDGDSDTGVSPTVFLPLGTTTVSLIVNDGTVDSGADTVDITVQDTTPPEVTANLVPIKVEDNEGTCEPVCIVNDICDSNPTVTAVIELPFVPGVDCEYKYKNGVIKVEGPSITLSVTAVDTSGNMGTATATLEFTGEPG